MSANHRFADRDDFAFLPKVDFEPGYNIPPRLRERSFVDDPQIAEDKGTLAQRDALEPRAHLCEATLSMP
jgi:hypothetical protein